MEFAAGNCDEPTLRTSNKLSTAADVTMNSSITDMIIGHYTVG